MTEDKKPVTLDRLLRAYINIRNTRSANKREFEEKDADLRRKADRIEVALMQALDAAGSDQLKVKGIGMCIRSKKQKANARDWAAITDHIVKTGNVELLQRRLALGNVQAYADEHDGALPPGVELTTEIGVQVRRN